MPAMVQNVCEKDEFEGLVFLSQLQGSLVRAGSFPFVVGDGCILAILAPALAATATFEISAAFNLPAFIQDARRGWY